MKKLLALFLSIVFVTSLAGAIPAFAETHYVKNGDFEDGKFPVNWKGGTGITVEADADGNHFAQIKSDSSVYMSSPWYNLRPGDRVVLEFDLKIVSLTGSGSACVSVAFGGKKSDGSLSTIENKLNYNYYEHRGEWQHIKQEFLIPDNSYGISFLFRLLNGGEICYDNITLTDITNKTTLRVAYGDLELNRVPDGVNNLKAKLHYVPEGGNSESGNLIFAAYSGQALAALEITPFTATGSIYQEVLLDIPEDAKDISVKAYVWKNGQTPTPIAESEILPKKGRSAVFDRLITERMRAVYDASTYFYGHDADGKPNGGGPELMQKLIDDGINTFIFIPHFDKNGTGVDKNNDAMRNILKDFSDFADETGSMIFVKLNYGTNAPATMADYGLYHPGYSNSRKVVCPLAEGYWKDAMQRRMAIVAEFPKITGVVFDMEMYNGTGTRYNDPCFCDTCVANFAKKYPSDASANLVLTAADSRMSFAKLNSILTDYINWQATEIERITKSIREHLHSINPNLILGIMPCHDWLLGMEKGLGTEEMPVVIFEESSYSGNLAGNTKIMATMENKGYHVLHVAGLIPLADGERIPVSSFASKVSQAGMMNLGYWIYQLSYLQSNTDYYPELKKGNEAIDGALGLD